MNSMSALLAFAVAMVTYQCASAGTTTIDAAALAKVVAAGTMKSCAITSRAVLKDCLKLLAKNDDEMKTCAEEFTRTFPACFSPPKVAKESPSDCKKRCWRSYGGCTGYSQGPAEHFTCWNHKASCQRTCDSSDAVDKLYARVFVKRTTESCLSTCQGFADACLVSVNLYNDYLICILSKDTCRSDCHISK